MFIFVCSKPSRVNAICPSWAEAPVAKVFVGVPVKVGLAISIKGILIGIVLGSDVPSCQVSPCFGVIVTAP